MRKLYKIFLLMFIVVFCFACKKENIQMMKEKTKEIKKEESSLLEIEEEIGKEEVEKETEEIKQEKIDIDLSILSSTMVYGEVNQIKWYPEKHIGQVIKMNGNVSIFFDEKTQKTYYTCEVVDKTACCTQGIEFRLVNNEKLPEEYKEGSEITIVGKFNTYIENGKTYCELEESKII